MARRSPVSPDRARDAHSELGSGRPSRNCCLNSGNTVTGHLHVGIQGDQTNVIILAKDAELLIHLGAPTTATALRLYEAYI